MKTFLEVKTLLIFFWNDTKKLCYSIALALAYTLLVFCPLLFHRQIKQLLLLTIWALLVNLFHLFAKRVSIRLSNSKINDIKKAMLNYIYKAGTLENEQKSVAERLGNFNLLSNQVFVSGTAIYGQFIYGVFFLTGVGFLALYFFGWKLILLLPATGIIWLINYLLIKKIKNTHSQNHASYIQFNKELVGLSSYYQSFKILGLLKQKLNSSLEQMKAFGSSEIRLQDIRDINTFLNQTIIVLAFVLVAQNFKSGLSVGEVMIWTVISFEVKKILIALFQANGMIYQGSVAFSKIRPELDFTPIRPNASEEANWFSITWENLRFSYPNHSSAKNFPDFTFHRGDKLWIKGENGSGKTTLWKLIFGIYTPQTGKVYFLPSNRSVIPESIPIGLVTEPVNLIPGKLWEVIGAFTHTKMEVEHHIRQCGLEEYLDEIPGGLDHDLEGSSGKLSVGQLKVTQLLQALMQKPDVLILDEPFAAVDSKLCLKIVHLLENQHKETSLVYISHQNFGLSFNKEIQL